MSLETKVALVTGGGSGIGRACAIRLAEDGAKVVVSDINLEAATMVTREIQEKGGVAIGVAMDVTSESSVLSAFDTVQKQWGRVDILLSNAGIQVVYPFEEFPFEEWQKMLRIHADGAFLSARSAYGIMKEKGGGQISLWGVPIVILPHHIKPPIALQNMES